MSGEKSWWFVVNLGGHDAESLDRDLGNPSRRCALGVAGVVARHPGSEQDDGWVYCRANQTRTHDACSGIRGCEHDDEAYDG